MRSESFVASVDRWRENNPERYRSAHHARQAAKRARNADAADDRSTRLAFARLSRRAKRLGMAIDHATPMNGCRACGAQGKHEPSNWQLLTSRENSAKGNRCMSCWQR